MNYSREFQNLQKLFQNLQNLSAKGIRGYVICGNLYTFAREKKQLVGKALDEKLKMLSGYADSQNERKE